MPSQATAVLIVDDHEDTREGYATFLRWRGYLVECASNGDEVFERIRTRRPDLIVLDVHLRGGVTGLDVLARLRSLYTRPRLPVILLTGSDVADDKLRRAPADLLLQKPVLPEELVGHILEVMRSGGLA